MSSNIQENSLPVPANDCREGEAERGTAGPISTQDPGTDLTDRRIKLCPISRLTPYRNNARTHSKKQIRQIANSIKRFGFNNPVLVDDAGEIIAGHGRVEAAKLLGLAGVPTLRLSHLSSAETRAYVLADNRLAEKAGWDKEILAIELQSLIDLDFQVEITGFETPEIDILLDQEAESKGAASGPEDDVPALPAGQAVARTGNLWLLGSHRLFCGNALEDSAYDTVMAGERADMVFTDPSYNVPIEGHVSGLGRVHHREFAMASGEMTETAFTKFLETAFGHMASNSSDGSIHFVCMDWRHMLETLNAGRAVYSELKNLAVWNKSNGAWARSTGRSTSWCSSGRTAPRLTSTASSWASMGAIAPTSGTTPESTPCGPDGWRSSPCIRPSSRSPWWRTPSKTARTARASSSTHFWAQAQR
jgi:ParB-like nuclease domain